MDEKIEEKKAISAFVSKVNVDVLRNGCWMWTASKFRTGYGAFMFRGKAKSAHRISYRMFRGSIPDGMVVRHKCDVRACVRPGHLELGTSADNTRDMFERNRPYRPKGEDTPHAKLTDESVIEIRRLFGLGATSKNALARRFGVSHTTIRCALSGKTWRHI